jgi:hypothetical protein
VLFGTLFKPMALHLLCCQGLAAGYYRCALDALQRLPVYVVILLTESCQKENNRNGATLEGAIKSQESFKYSVMVREALL